MKKRTLNLICATLLTLGCAQTVTPGDEQVSWGLKIACMAGITATTGLAVQHVKYLVNKAVVKESNKNSSFITKNARLFGTLAITLIAVSSMQTIVFLVVE